MFGSQWSLILPLGSVAMRYRRGNLSLKGWSEHHKSSQKKMFFHCLVWEKQAAQTYSKSFDMLIQGLHGLKPSFPEVAHIEVSIMQGFRDFFPFNQVVQLALFLSFPKKSFLLSFLFLKLLNKASGRWTCNRLADLPKLHRTKLVFPL